MSQMKNESGHIYGDFVVTEMVKERRKSNGCINWVCVCRYCGATRVICGNDLRFHPNRRCWICRNSRKAVKLIE